MVFELSRRNVPTCPDGMFIAGSILHWFTGRHCERHCDFMFSAHVNSALLTDCNHTSVLMTLRLLPLAGTD